MSFLIVLGLYAAVLCALVFVSRRRAGLAVLALVAGALLAQLWSGTLVLVMAKAGVVVHEAVIVIPVTLLPALLIVGRGAKVHSHLGAVIAGIVIALLAVSLTYESFAQLVVLDEASTKIVGQLLPYKTVIVTACVMYGLFDVLAKHSHKARSGHKK